MASSSFTPNLGLCDWDADDCPKRADFVSDNQIVDSVLGGHLSNSAVHMSASEKSKALTPYEVISYQGDGNAAKTLNTTFAPKTVFVFKKYEPLSVTKNSVNFANSAMGYYGLGCSAGLSISTTGFTVNQDAQPTDGVRACLNEYEAQYVAIVFK